MASYLLYLTVFSLNSVRGLPASYCLYPINKLDCGGPPTPVFSYWKPGSRCEIEIWRGCPSFNRFDNEASCTHHCIGKLTDDSAENKVSNDTVTTEYDNMVSEENDVNSSELKDVLSNLNTKDLIALKKVIDPNNEILYSYESAHYSEVVYDDSYEEKANRKKE